MKKVAPIILTIAATAAMAAGDAVYIACGDGQTLGADLESVDSIYFTADENNMIIASGAVADTVAIETVDSLYFDGMKDKITVTYTSDGVKVENPFILSGVKIAIDGSDVVVTSTASDELEYVVSGESADGMFKIYSDKKIKLTLNGLTLTNNDGPAINIQSGKKTTLTLADGTVNSLTDGKKYTACGEEDMKATLFSEGQIVVEGNGTLNVVGKKKHGICSDDYVRISSGVVNVTEAASDGIHANDYVQIDGGTVNITASGDGIDGDEGYVQIGGGDLTVNVGSDTAKGIKCDGAITMTGGNVTVNTTGGVVVEDGDPSYCTAVKTKLDFSMSGGELTVVSTGAAGKGVSADGNVTVTGGTINISTSGNGSTYTTASNTTDSYSATGIKADGNIEILGGEITVTASGTAGKGISADGTLVIGDADNAPTVNVTTTGKKFLVSGYGDNADYANPKAIKAEGDLTVNNGNVTVKTTQDGGEGLESKATITINGGVIEAETYDDAINASTNITINGGKVYCNASGNDGIDSNGTLTVTGGLVIASGTTQPEEGFDCDQNTFTITGGVLVGTGGSTSTPTSSACSQRSVIYSASLSGKLIHVEDSNGNSVLTYQVPSKYNNSVTLLFSDAALASGTTYKIYTGGTITDATEFHGYYTGGTYSGGTQSTTFTPSSMVTTVGNSGGGPGGGRPGGGGGGRPSVKMNL